jgi:hypothetical protein
VSTQKGDVRAVRLGHKKGESACLLMSPCFFNPILAILLGLFIQLVVET